MIDLSDNTNRWGMPPAARRALAESDLTSAYPEGGATSLCRALAEYLGVEVDHILCGCGSDDVLDAALRALARPGDRIAIPEPTFRMVPVFAGASRLEVMMLPPRLDLALDVEAVLRCRPQVVYLCSPNNPTGMAIPIRDVQRILEESDAIVIVDEAYADFNDVDALDHIVCHPRLLVVRTFSKAFGLAALRVGYAIAAPGLITRIAATRGPFQVSAPASLAAVAALKDGLPWVRETARRAVANRDVLARELAALGHRPLASRANFLLVPVSDARAVAATMRERGVAVRAFAGLPCIGDAIRITVGPWVEMEHALRALSAAVTNEASIRSGACA